MVAIGLWELFRSSAMFLDDGWVEVRIGLCCKVGRTVSDSIPVLPLVPHNTGNEDDSKYKNCFLYRAYLETSGSQNFV